MMFSGRFTAWRNLNTNLRKRENESVTDSHLVTSGVNIRMITFKQFLTESNSPTPGNVDGSFNVGDVKFDNERGLGATPMGANILYMGAVAWIKPSTFRKLALKADRGVDAKNIEKLLRDGKAMATPFLIIDVIGEPDAPKKIKVTSHEGRARADAFKAINGDVPMPVQLHPSGLRARHLSPDFFKWIEENGLVAEKSDSVVALNATEYFWNGTRVKV